MHTLGGYPIRVTSPPISPHPGEVTPQLNSPPGEPNGGVLENCAVVWPIRNGWNDYMCFQKAYGYCEIQPRPILIIRGESDQVRTKVIGGVGSCAIGLKK